MTHTPELSGSGQLGPCAKCGLLPTPEGHDGCLGTLHEHIVMNACCGHGNDRMAYVQFWDKSDVRGPEAINKHPDPSHRYACKDRPRPGEPWLRLEESNSCGHSYRRTDPHCQGCKWRQDP